MDPNTPEYPDTIEGHEAVPFIESEKILVWRFPCSISQSSLGGREEVSSACTLIALKTAEQIHLHDVEMPTNFVNIEKKDRSLLKKSISDSSMFRLTKCVPKRRNPDRTKRATYRSFSMECPQSVMSCLVNGIVEGNELHFEKCGQDNRRSFTLPQGIEACGSRFEELDYTNEGQNMAKDLPRLMRQVVRLKYLSDDPRIFFTIIASQRTVLVVFERSAKTITFFDPHRHRYACSVKKQQGNESVFIKHGAVIATAKFDDLNQFSHWIGESIFPDMRETGKNFELSVVRFSGTPPPLSCAPLLATITPPLAIFSKAVKRKANSMKMNDNTNWLHQTQPTTRPLMSWNDFMDGWSTRMREIDPCFDSYQSLLTSDTSPSYTIGTCDSSQHTIQHYDSFIDCSSCPKRLRLINPSTLQTPVSDILQFSSNQSENVAPLPHPLYYSNPYVENVEAGKSMLQGYF